MRCETSGLKHGFYESILVHQSCSNCDRNPARKIMTKKGDKPPTRQLSARQARRQTRRSQRQNTSQDEPAPHNQPTAKPRRQKKQHDHEKQNHTRRQSQRRNETKNAAATQRTDKPHNDIRADRRRRGLRLRPPL